MPNVRLLHIAQQTGRQAGKQSKAGKQGGRQCKQRPAVAMANLTYVQLARNMLTAGVTSQE